MAKKKQSAPDFKMKCHNSKSGKPVWTNDTIWEVASSFLLNFIFIKHIFHNLLLIWLKQFISFRNNCNKIWIFNKNSYDKGSPCSPNSNMHWPKEKKVTKFICLNMFITTDTIHIWLALLPFPLPQPRSLGRFLIFELSMYFQHTCPAVLLSPFL